MDAQIPYVLGLEATSHAPLNRAMKDQKIRKFAILVAEEKLGPGAIILLVRQRLAPRFKERCHNLIELCREACLIFAITRWHINDDSSARSS